MTLIPQNCTQPARYVLEMAQEITQPGFPTEPEHILYAILQIPNNEGMARLQTMAVNPQRLIDGLKVHWRQWTVGAPVTVQPGTWSNGSLAVIHRASEAAAQARSAQIDSSHLLTGLTESNSVARRLLQEQSVTTQSLQDRAGTDNATTAPIDRGREAWYTKRQATTPNRGQGFSIKDISWVFWLLLALTAGAAYLCYEPSIPNKPFAVFLFIFMGWIVSLCLHEFGHALSAYLLGDDSVVARGYLTLNPFRYTDPIFSIVFPLIILIMGGLGLPGGSVYIDINRIRGSKRSIVAAAGPLANLLFALGLWLPYRLAPDEWFANYPEFWGAWSFLFFLQMTAIIFNLIPVPPLDGYKIVYPFLPSGMQNALIILERWGFLILMLLLWNTPLGSEVFSTVFRLLIFCGIEPGLAIYGLELFHFWEYRG